MLTPMLIPMTLTVTLTVVAAGMYFYKSKSFTKFRKSKEPMYLLLLFLIFGLTSCSTKTAFL